jgi:hypothetical protein
MTSLLLWTPEEKLGLVLLAHGGKYGVRFYDQNPTRFQVTPDVPLTESLPCPETPESIHGLGIDLLTEAARGYNLLALPCGAD